jgi:hypothetical protein
MYAGPKVEDIAIQLAHGDEDDGSVTPGFVLEHAIDDSKATRAFQESRYSLHADDKVVSGRIA